tara:strand:- start:278 stop:481 length:204 start_codon:yes stop_codon:yes gene_type:complete
MSTTDIINNYTFLNNINQQKHINFISTNNEKKYEEKYSFETFLQNIKEKKDILVKKEKINYLIFKEV